MEKTTPANESKLVRWIKLLGVAASVGVAFGIFLKLIGFEDFPVKGALKTAPPGVPTALYQILTATTQYGFREMKPPSSLEDLVGIAVVTSDGQLTNFSIQLLEAEIGAKATTINYFPEFQILDRHVSPVEIVLAFIPDPKDKQYCQVTYLGRHSRRKGGKWAGFEKMELVRVNQKSNGSMPIETPL